MRRLLAWLRAQRDEYRFVQRYMHYGIHGIRLGEPMKTIRIKRIDTGVAIEGRPMDLVIFADVLMRLAEMGSRFPPSARVAEIGVMIMAAVTGGEGD